MIHLTRRTTLRGLGASGGLVLAGCLADDDPDTGPDDDDEHGDGESDDDAEPDDGTGGEPVFEIHQVAIDRSGPVWDYRDRPGFCTFVRDPGNASWLFDEDDTATASFVEETEFDSSLLLYVESVGPNTCYTELEVTDVGIENGTLVGNATAIDASEEGNDVCGPSLTYPGALIRITADPLPDAARVTVTDGWGDSADVTPEDGLVDPASLPGAVRPDADPDVVPASLDCPDDGFERLDSGYDGDVSWGSGSDVEGRSGLELRVVDPDRRTGDGDGTDADGDGADADDVDDADDDHPSTTFERGDAVRVDLTNVSTDRLGTGSHWKYDLELYTEEGWTEIRVFDTDGPPLPHTDELRHHQPGETVSWTFTLTEEGIAEEHQQADRVRVCPDLQSGRYRFVFWGADDVAVAFDLEA